MHSKLVKTKMQHGFIFLYVTFHSPLYYFHSQQDSCNGEEGSFRVLVENEACGIVGHRCAKAITIFYQGGLIVLQHGEVTHAHTHICS